MALLALLIAQVLDPIRWAFVAAVMLATFAIRSRIGRWLAIGVSLFVLAVALPQMFLGMSGDEAADMALLGMTANVFLALTFVGLVRLARWVLSP